MSKTQIEPYRPVYPSPAALITTISEDDTPNIITLGECFNISIARPPIVGIAIRKVTYSYDLICRTPEFAVNLPTTDIIEQVDGIGCVSGSECNKFERFDLTPFPADKIRPPIIKECPVSVECRVLDEQEVGDHQLFLGHVIAEHVDESCLAEDGSPDPCKLDMLIYAGGHYFSAGECLAEHGFSKAWIEDTDEEQ